VGDLVSKTSSSENKQEVLLETVYALDSNENFPPEKQMKRYKKMVLILALFNFLCIVGLFTFWKGFVMDPIFILLLIISSLKILIYLGFMIERDHQKLFQKDYRVYFLLGFTIQGFSAFVLILINLILDGSSLWVFILAILYGIMDALIPWRVYTYEKRWKHFLKSGNEHHSLNPIIVAEISST